MGEQAGCQKLDPKVMDVLLALARNAGKVVLREDLLARLWANAVVTDESLSRCIYELRRQLSLAGGDERYKAMFETVPKRGYRLNAQLTPSPLNHRPPNRRRGDRRSAGGGISSRSSAQSPSRHLSSGRRPLR